MATTQALTRGVNDAGLPRRVATPSFARVSAVPRGDQLARDQAELLRLCKAARDGAFAPVAALRRELCSRVSRTPADKQVLYVVVGLLKDRSAPAHAHFEAVFLFDALFEGLFEEAATLDAPRALLSLLSTTGSRERPDLCSNILAVLSRVLAAAPNVGIRDQLLSAGAIDELGGLFVFMQTDARWGPRARLEVLRGMTAAAEGLCAGRPGHHAEQVDCMFEYFSQVVLDKEAEDSEMLTSALHGLCHLLKAPESVEGAKMALNRLREAGGEELKERLAELRRRTGLLSDAARDLQAACTSAEQKAVEDNSENLRSAGNMSGTPSKSRPIGLGNVSVTPMRSLSKSPAPGQVDGSPLNRNQVGGSPAQGGA